jgi:hypothetical protein
MVARATVQEWPRFPSSDLTLRLQYCDGYTWRASLSYFL